jgi:SAM-dependent methyltransferase
MNRHPGGEEHTARLLELAALPKGARILDMGAGGGETLQMLWEAGFDAVGIDLQPRSESIRKGDFLHTDYGDESFDSVLSQCAFFISGDPARAVKEAHRLLKPGGVLMLSDVFFEEPALPGFSIRHREDMTALWREYYLEALWREDVECDCFPKGKCRYWSIIAMKEETSNGSV